MDSLRLTRRSFQVSAWLVTTDWNPEDEPVIMEKIADREISDVVGILPAVICQTLYATTCTDRR
ncbi:MAG: hypothetical protein CMJ62_01880 [Planctomycetaceae bacterium]|nr:hypothetical protein [Planctomycetaceae bacterium]